MPRRRYTFSVYENLRDRGPGLSAGIKSRRKIEEQRWGDEREAVCPEASFDVTSTCLPKFSPKLDCPEGKFFNLNINRPTPFFQNYDPCEAEYVASTSSLNAILFSSGCPAIKPLRLYQNTFFFLYPSSSSFIFIKGYALTPWLHREAYRNSKTLKTTMLKTYLSEITQMGTWISKIMKSKCSINFSATKHFLFQFFFTQKK